MRIASNIMGVLLALLVGGSRLRGSGEGSFPSADSHLMMVFLRRVGLWFLFQAKCLLRRPRSKLGVLLLGKMSQQTSGWDSLLTPSLLSVENGLLVYRPGSLYGCRKLCDNHIVEVLEWSMGISLFASRWFVFVLLFDLNLSLFGCSFGCCASSLGQS